jgi:hypothetical protein
MGFSNVENLAEWLAVNIGRHLPRGDISALLIVAHETPRQPKLSPSAPIWDFGDVQERGWGVFNAENLAEWGRCFLLCVFSWEEWRGDGRPHPSPSFSCVYSEETLLSPCAIETFSGSALAGSHEKRSGAFSWVVLRRGTRMGCVLVPTNRGGLRSGQTIGTDKVRAALDSRPWIPIEVHERITLRPTRRGRRRNRRHDR